MITFHTLVSKGIEEQDQLLFLLLFIHSPYHVIHRIGNLIICLIKGHRVDTGDNEEKTLVAM